MTSIPMTVGRSGNGAMRRRWENIDNACIVVCGAVMLKEEHTETADVDFRSLVKRNEKTFDHCVDTNNAWAVLTV